MTQFGKKYIFATDHKVIGAQFVFSSLFWLAICAVLTFAICWQFTWPWTDMPIFGPSFFAERGGQISPHFFSALLSMNGTVAIFFVLVPLLLGGVGNCLIAPMIGTHEMAFPRLNALSYWLMWPAYILLTLCFFELTQGPATDLASHPPLTSQLIFCPGGSRPQTLWILSLMFVSLSTLVSAINITITIAQLRTNGMHFHRLPMTAWATLLLSIVLLATLPLISAALTMQLSDRLFATSFFGSTPTAYERAPLWSHLLGFYSQASLYVLILPAIGMVADIVSSLSRKSPNGIRAMGRCLAGMAMMGWFIWILSLASSFGLPQLTIPIAATFAIVAILGGYMVISLLSTLLSNRIQFTSAMLFCFLALTLLAVCSFLSLGISMRQASGAVNKLHSITGLFHVEILLFAHFAAVAGIYFWFPMMFGKMMSERLGKLHFLLTLIFLTGTIWPMFIAGETGFSRAMLNLPRFATSTVPRPLHQILTWSVLGLGLSQLVFAVNLIRSRRWGNQASASPWPSNSLGWVDVGDSEGETPSVSCGSPQETRMRLNPGDGQWYPQ